MSKLGSLKKLYGMDFKEMYEINLTKDFRRYLSVLRLFQSSYMRLRKLVSLQCFDVNFESIIIAN